MEDMLSGDERLNILKQIPIVKKDSSAEETKEENKKIDSKTSLSTLLEESLKKQTQSHKEDIKINDETRKKILESVKPKFNIISGWRF